MKYRIFRGFLALPICAALCAPGFAQEKPARTAIPDAAWAPAKSPGQKLVYGTDDRIDVYQETNPQRLDWAHSACALVSGGRITQNGDGSYTLQTSPFLPDGLPPCDGERFANQPTGAFCSGWLAGDDIVVTAGHCFDNSDLNSTRFVFGFEMLDADTPITHFEANQVYVGVQLLGHRLEGDFDYSVVRVDRVVTAPGAIPFEIRRAGTVGVGTKIGVIGHPSGLPKKIAFGNETAVRDGGTDGFFVANLDTYGGNSGSPVINASSGIAEGILVRGDTDYISQGSCAISNVVPNNGGAGEEISKSTSFMEFVPDTASHTGNLSLDRTGYACTSTLGITLNDLDLRGMGTANVQVSTNGGDGETVALAETSGNSGRFGGSIAARPNGVVVGNGTLEVAETTTVTVSYADEHTSNEAPGTVTVTARIDCTPPMISEIEVPVVGGAIATIEFETNERTLAIVRYGTQCGALDRMVNDPLAQEHSINLQELDQLTTYYFTVEAADAAGNSVVADNGGACFQFKTSEPLDYFTQQLSGDLSAFENRSFTFSPAEGPQGYEVCTNPVAHLPVDPAGATKLSLSDDSFMRIELTGGKSIPFFGATHTVLFVGSNGYITFTAGDDSYEDLLDIHFGAPRVSALYTDLNPAKSGGIYFRQLPDRAVITYLDVPSYDPTGNYPPADKNTAQAELFFDGTIRVTYGVLFTETAILGLSRGSDTPSDFEPSDFTRYPFCFSGGADSDGDGLPDLDEVAFFSTDPAKADTDGDGMNDGYEVHNALNPLTGDADADADGDSLTNLQEAQRGTRANVVDSDRDGVADRAEVLAGTDPTGAADPHAADINGNGKISLSEVARVVQLFNAEAYSCNPLTADGYQLGAGPKDCARHSSDYDATAFRLSLTELLRTIELSLAGAYTRDLYSEDTFAPVP